MSSMLEKGRIMDKARPDADVIVPWQNDQSRNTTVQANLIC